MGGSFATIAPPSVVANPSRLAPQPSLVGSVDRSPVGMSDDWAGLSELWDAQRLAEYLGVTKHYVYRLTSEHRIRFVRVGKCLRFRPDDVAAWLDAQAVDVASESTVQARRGRPRKRDLAA